MYASIAISRKKGLSKTKLRQALEAAGITYLHLPVLGNPKNNRAGFWEPGTSQWLEARARFSEMITSNQANEALRGLVKELDNGNVGLLCFEASQNCCHRDVVLEELKNLSQLLLPA